MAFKISNERTEKNVSQISKIMNNKLYIGSYIGLHNNSKACEVDVYTNKNGHTFYYIMRVFVDSKNNIDYMQGVSTGDYYLNDLARHLGAKYEHLGNQNALERYWQDLGCDVHKVLTVGFK